MPFEHEGHYKKAVKMLPRGFIGADPAHRTQFLVNLLNKFEAAKSLKDKIKNVTTSAEKIETQEALNTLVGQLFEDLSSALVTDAIRDQYQSDIAALFSDDGLRDQNDGDEAVGAVGGQDIANARVAVGEQGAAALEPELIQAYQGLNIGQDIDYLEDILGGVPWAQSEETHLTRQEMNNLVKRGKFNNICLEESLLFMASKYRLELNLDFANYQARNDIQLDVVEVGFEKDIFLNMGMHVEGKTEADILALFDKLDKNAFYILRSGTNGGAGHYSTVFFEQGCWCLFDSENRPILKLIEQRRLTKTGRDKFVMPLGKWGEAIGQYSLTYIEVAKDQIIRLAEQVNQIRTKP